jgi:hypothetical protein
LSDTGELVIIIESTEFFFPFAVIPISGPYIDKCRIFFLLTGSVFFDFFKDSSFDIRKIINIVNNSLAFTEYPNKIISTFYH